MKYIVETRFLKEAVNELLKAEKSIVKDGFVKIIYDDTYKCSDPDLGNYIIKFDYHLHLIHLGMDISKAESKLSDELKKKWHITH